MKKSVIICIAIVFIASVVIINFFGMKTSVYNEIIPVTHIECTNVTDENNGVKVGVDDQTGVKTLMIKFESACVKADNGAILDGGTMLTILHKVYPENASNRDIRYVYSPRDSFEFYKDENGRETGLILFYSKASFDVKIMSQDGRKVFTTISVWAY